MDEIVQFDFPTDSPKIIKVIGATISVSDSRTTYPIPFE